MPHIGEINTLTVARSTPQGLYLIDSEGEEVLLPGKYVTPDMTQGQEIDVFVYRDSEDRPVATTQTPLIQLGSVAMLNVVQNTEYGAFLDWGLEKHLLLPYREQLYETVPGQQVLVTLALDAKTNRLIASERLDSWLPSDAGCLREGQRVSLTIWRKSLIGFTAVIDGRQLGLLHHKNAFRALHYGEELMGHVQEIRPDGKVNLSINQAGTEGHFQAVDKILAVLEEMPGGFLALNDASTPEEIALKLEMSKKMFKRAVGTLLRRELVQITPDGIQLLR